MTDNNPSEELIALIQKALTMEHQAYIQYLSHAEIPTGLTSNSLINQLKDNASDELKHASTLRNLLGDFFGVTPTMDVAPTELASTDSTILSVNLQAEKDAVLIYQDILEKLDLEKNSLPFAYFKVEREIRLILIEESEHISELKRLASINP